MKIPTLKLLKSSDFSELKWFPRLAGTVNQFMRQVTNGLNKKITFSENIDCELPHLIIDGTYPVKTSWNRPSKPTGLWITNITRVDGADTNLSNALTVEWSYSNGVVSIDNVVGLSASSTDKYTLSLIIITG